MSRRFLMVLVACIAVVIGVFWLTRPNKDNGGTGGTKSSLSNHIYSHGSTGVTLIEYGDYQCPACGAFEPLVEQLRDKYKGQITFQFRNLPLDSIHQNARAGARAAEAADKQGKFWEMHDLLYQGQQAWGQLPNPTATFEAYAAQLKLDMAKYKADYASQAVNTIINADIAKAQELKLTSTPSFILDGKHIENPASQEEFDKVLVEAIAKKSAGASPAPSVTPSPTPSPSPAQ